MSKCQNANDDDTHRAPRKNSDSSICIQLNPHISLRLVTVLWTQISACSSEAPGWICRYPEYDNARLGLPGLLGLLGLLGLAGGDNAECRKEDAVGSPADGAWSCNCNIISARGHQGIIVSRHLLSWLLGLAWTEIASDKDE